MKIIVTGGAGFIGSHTVIELQNAGYDVVVVDNLANSSEKSLERVEKITGKKVPFYKVDILDREGLNEVFAKDYPFFTACVCRFLQYCQGGNGRYLPISQRCGSHTCNEFGEIFALSAMPESKFIGVKCHHRL